MTNTRKRVVTSRKTNSKSNPNRSSNRPIAKDKERDDRINSLDTKVSSMEGKLDKILNVLSSNSNPTLKL